MPFLAEAMRAYEEGLGTADDIDTGARVGLNHPMGPLELADFIGLDVCLGVMRVLDEGLGRRAVRARRAVLRRAGRGRASRPEDRTRLPHVPATASGPAGERRAHRGGATAPGDGARVRDPRAGTDRHRARRGRALRPLAVHEDGRARVDRGAAPRGDRRRGLLVPRLDAGDGGARRGRHGDGRVAVGPPPVAVPGRDLGDAGAAGPLAAGDAQRRGARAPSP